MVCDEIRHHLDAFRVVKVDDLDVMLAEEVFRALEVLVFADDDARDFVEQCGACAHDAGREGGDEGEGVPIGSASCVFDANCFCVGSWVA